MNRDKSPNHREPLPAPAEAADDALPLYRPEDFFFLRSPLLPMDELERLLAAEAAPGGLGEAGDPLLRLAAEPAIAEALFIASPELMAGLDRVLAGGEKQDPKKADRLRQSLTRYLLRLITRPTPFGLFAGGSLGAVGARTELALGPRSAYRRHTRLDMDYLDRLARDLENDAALRAELTYRPNSSLYRAAGRLRYAEGRLDGAARTYHLVALRADAYLDAALGAAAAGARLAEIARAVAGADNEGEIDLEEAEAFVHELIDTQVLVSDLGPRVTGELPIHGLIARLGEIERTRPAAACLAEVRDRLAALDEEPLGSPAETYREVARTLEPLGTTIDLPRLFQVDMTKAAAGLSLGPEVIGELKRAIGFLLRLRAGTPADAFTSFREDFLRRYEAGQLVPLTELLDEEAGIGFQRSTAVGSERSPLLEGIPFPARPGDAQIRWSRAQDLLVRKTFEAAGRGADQVVFTDADLAGLGEASGEPARAVFYTAFQAIFALAAPSPEAVDRGDFRLLFRGASGASGAAMLGRFCHADAALADRVREHLRHEEGHRPEAVFAEIVHLPEGRVGNILLRPQLRQYEIPFLGLGGAGGEHQLPIADLLATVQGDQVSVYSRRLGKQVIPRLSSAHNYTLRGLGIYRFLSALQHQGSGGGLAWQWGPLENLPYLPRVVYGRTVLAPARWRVEKSELRSFLGAGSDRAGSDPTGIDRERLAEWRRERRIPRRVLLADGDNELFVDFESPLILEAFAAIVRNRPAIGLVEHLQEEDLVVSGPEGRFKHEIVLPFVRRAEPAPPAAARAPGLARLATGQETENHAPGSRWVYAKLYTGTATADGVLEEVAGRLTRRFGKTIDNFFFLRFADPDFHLRLRFELTQEGPRLELTRQLTAIAGELLRQGRIWDLRFETYRPEIDRYGGGEGLRLCEKIFHADSAAALAMLSHLQGDAGAEARWLAALCSVDDLLATVLGDDHELRLASLEGLARGFGDEFRFDKHTRQSINNRLRGHKKALDAALDRRAEPGSPLALALPALAERRRALRGPVEQLRRLAAAGRLTVAMRSLGSSLAHMSVNRLIAAEARAHEAVIYEILHRHLLSQEARRSAAGETRGKIRETQPVVA